MIPVLDARQMRAADRAAIQGGIAASELMENAATGLAEEIVRWYPRWKRIVVACGPGNNGGDGLAAARLLAGRGLAVTVFTLRDPEFYRSDAAENATRATKMGLELRAMDRRGGLAAFCRCLRDGDGVLDALFGTGLSRGLEGAAARAVSAVNSAGRPVVAADLPSGLSADSGRLLGPSVRADLTVAFAAAKFCHVFSPARDCCGSIVVRDIGIPDRILERQKSRLRITQPQDVRALLAPRPLDSHKADFGRLAIIAGSRGKAGASILAARAALRAGAGLVTVFCPFSIEAAVVGALPEAMTRGLPEREGALSAEGTDPMLDALKGFDAGVAGPGLGTAPGTVALLRALLNTRLPLVCDADALNAFARRPRAFSRRRAATILTPHPGEAGRLLGTGSRQVQADRFAAVLRLARESGAVVLLKGSSTLVATPAGRVTANPTGTPLMSTAGAGDVLSGAIGAFVAGGMGAEPAAFTAAYLHGAAGQALATSLGDAGLLSGELADAFPAVRAALCAAGGRRGRLDGGDGTGETDDD